jgi:hypothetical protein
MQPYSYFLSNIPAGIAIFSSTMDELGGHGKLWLMSNEF